MMPSFVNKSVVLLYVLFRAGFIHMRPWGSRFVGALYKNSYTATYTAGLETFRDRPFKTETKTKTISIKTKTKSLPPWSRGLHPCLLVFHCNYKYLLCFDNVGWALGRAPGL